MLFWLCLILLVVLIALAFFASYIEDKFGYSITPWKCVLSSFACWLSATSVVVSAFLGLAIIGMLVVISINNLSGAGYAASNEQKYEALLYKAKTESIRDEFGIVNKEYVDEVQKWNEDVVKYNSYSKSKWIGIFYPEKYYGNYKTIDLNDIKMKE